MPQFWASVSSACKQEHLRPRVNYGVNRSACVLASLLRTGMRAQLWLLATRHMHKPASETSPVGKHATLHVCPR